jgi:hypothetical protein
MRTSAYAVGASLLVIVACSASGPTEEVDRSRSALTTVFDYPVSGHALNACNGGERVDLTGVVHFVCATNTTADGVTHIVSHGNYSDLHGVGEVSGATYVLTSTDTLQYEYSSTPFSKVQYGRLHLISQGPTPNEQMDVTYFVSCDVAHCTTTPEFQVVCP